MKEENVKKKYAEKLNQLPDYCKSFFYAKDDVYAAKTKLAYAIDLYTFFYYLIDTEPDRFPYNSVKDFTLDELNSLTSEDIIGYMIYLNDYAMKNPDGTVSNYKNSATGKKRKLATLKSFFRYLNVNRKIENDPTHFVDTPKTRKKEIIVLSEKEQKKLQHAVETGKDKTTRALAFHEHTKYRDIAILTTFLGTGLRVSELVGLDINDLDFDEQRVLTKRKGEGQEFVYFNKKVLSAITDYLDIERNELIKGKGDPNENGPLFLSNRGTRISVDRVERIIKEAAATVLPPNLKISCHTLRKTYGTAIFEQFDLLTAQHALGHSSSTTTATYYTRFNKEKLRQLKDV